MPGLQRTNQWRVIWQSRQSWRLWRRGLGRLAPLPLMLALALLLAACGVPATTGPQAGDTASATGTATASPSGGTPVSSMPPTLAVTLSADRASYSPSSTINVTLTNHRSTSIFTFDHQTGCTILTLQRQTATGWEATGGCAMGRLTQRVEIKAGATMTIALAPGAGQIHVAPWPTGTYRAVLNYTLQTQDMSATIMATTPTFTIA